MNTKILIAIVVVLVVGVGGFFAWKLYFNKPAPVDTGGTATTTPVQVTNTFASTTMGIVVSYPLAYTLDAANVDSSFGPNKPIHGVKFTIPQTMATGTNLGSDSGVLVQQLPHAKKCTADIFILDNVKASTVTENGVAYSVASTTGAAAGNRYEETVYALPTSSPCTAVRYFIHYGVLENYPDGSVQAFDHEALLQSFDGIRSSLVMTTGSAQ